MLIFNLTSLPTPCYVTDERLLLRNLKILRAVADEAGCKILLAQKAFSMFSLYPLIGRWLDGTAASGLFEARLGREEMGGETHVFSAAYRPEEMAELVRICGHIVFNSFNQWETYRETALGAGAKCGIRVNPQRSTQESAIYDPCAPGSRLGVTAREFRPAAAEGLTGLHFHTLCEQNSDALETTLEAFEERFGFFLPRVSWVNFGGGHHITRGDYDTERLISLIRRFRERYGAQVYLEPGEAVALNAGFLVTRVLDVVRNETDIAILDASAACHMPDVLEMPYRPRVSPPDGAFAGNPGEYAHTFRLAGPTCLAGDIIGDYSFPSPLKAGDTLIFHDMAIYTMVKNNTFNGMPLPAIAVAREDGGLQVVKTFGYGDFKARLS
ncbi:MAG: carboxynorspermidine decarboxylase [Oscillospiraceae bacterium]|nr:carboxynorspermidine decarboxylase [Oscillospiraceae bacterium]